MLRQEIVEGILQVIAALRETGLVEALDRATEHPPSERQQTNLDILEGLRRYALASNAFSSAAREVAKRIGLGVLDKTDIWLQWFLGRARAAFTLFTKSSMM